MNIVILGSPASGKGTQAQLLSKEYGLYHLQTGDIARDLAKKDERIKQIVDSGKLVPEDEMTMYVIDVLNKDKSDMKNIIFEGFPRFVGQHEALENFLKNKGDDIDAVISLDIDKDEAIKRISARRICNKCGEVYNLITNPPGEEGKCRCGGDLIQREDDKPEAINMRFEYYKNNTKELIDYLERKKKLIKVDGSKPIEVVFENIKAVLDKIISK
jgi:adenylate kinase